MVPATSICCHSEAFIREYRMDGSEVHQEKMAFVDEFVGCSMFGMNFVLPVP